MKIYPRNLPSTAVIWAIMLLGRVSSQYYYQRQTTAPYMTSSPQSVTAIGSGPASISSLVFLVGDSARSMVVQSVQIVLDTFSLVSSKKDDNCSGSKSNFLLFSLYCVHHRVTNRDDLLLPRRPFRRTLS